MRLTRGLIHAGKSQRGGWSEKQIRLLGVAWPPIKGWMQMLEGSEIQDAVYHEFLALKDRHIKPKMLKKLSATMFKEELTPLPERKRLSRAEIALIEERARRNIRECGKTGSRLTTCTKSTCTYPACLC